MHPFCFSSARRVLCAIPRSLGAHCNALLPPNPQAKKKKGKKGKKKAAKKEKKVVDPLLNEIKALSLDEIQSRHADQLKQLKDIRRNRNYYMIERDAIQQYYYIVCQEVEELKTQLKTLEGDMEAKQKGHNDVKQIYLQKVTHMEYEHGHNLSMLRETARQDEASEGKRFEDKKRDLVAEKLKIEGDFVDDAKKYDAAIKARQEQYREGLAQIRLENVKTLERAKEKYAKRLQDLVEDLELRRRIEAHELEERKNAHINGLIKNHEKAFNEMRDYYNGLTKDNVGLIMALKEELEDLKKKQELHEKTIAEYTQRNSQLEEPKQEAERVVAELKVKLKTYEKDKTSLAHARARTVVLEEQLRKLRGEHKRMEVEYKTVQDECKELYDTFQDVVVTVQKRAQARNRELSGFLGDRKRVFETKKAQFSSIVKAASLDPTALQHVTSKVDEQLTEKNQEVRELRYENAKIAKAHDDLVRVYEAKIRKFGLPEQELGKRPLLGSTTSGPADLVV